MEHSSWGRACLAVSLPGTESLAKQALCGNCHACSLHQTTTHIIPNLHTPASDWTHCTDNEREAQGAGHTAPSRGTSQIQQLLPLVAQPFLPPPFPSFLASLQPSSHWKPASSSSPLFFSHKHRASKGELFPKKTKLEEPGVGEGDVHSTKRKSLPRRSGQGQKLWPALLVTPIQVLSVVASVCWELP